MRIMFTLAAIIFAVSYVSACEQTDIAPLKAKSDMAVDWLVPGASTTNHRLPVDIFKRIALLSENCMGLYATCKTLRDFDYDGMSKITMALPSRFVGSDVWAQIEKGKYPKWSSNVYALNIHQWNKFDLFFFGITDELNVRLEEEEIIEKRLFLLFRTVFCNLKEIHAFESLNTYHVRRADPYVLLKKYITIPIFYYKAAPSVLDRYSNMYFNPRRLRLYYDLYKCSDCNEDEWQAMLPFPSRVFEVLDSYGRLLQSRYGKATLDQISLSRASFFYHMGQFDELMHMIEKIIETRLLFGVSVLGYAEGLVPWSRKLSHLCHSETPLILDLIRTFIPDYGSEDYIQGCLKRDSKALLVLICEPEEQRQYQLTVLCSGAFDRCIGYDRTAIFEAFVNGLGEFYKEEQYVLLSKLLSMVEFKDLQNAVWRRPAYQNGIKLSPSRYSLWTWIGAGLKNTKNLLEQLTDEQFETFSYYVIAHEVGYNLFLEDDVSPMVKEALECGRSTLFE